MGEGSDESLTRIVAVFGWRKGTTGALVDVFVNDRKLSSARAGVTLISNPAHSGREMWWVAKLDLQTGTKITLDVKVGIRGAGRDTERSSKNSYTVDPESPIREFSVPKVGCRGFPLLKGPLSIVLEQTEQDITDEAVEALFDLSKE